MADPAQTNADQLAFWNGSGGATWVARQAHTDITLAPVSDALVALAAPHPGERILDVGCGCGATTLDFARAVGNAGRISALDISGPMLAEGRRRAEVAGVANIDWVQADPATADLEQFDVLASAFGVMFFGDPIAAFTHMRTAARDGARMAFVCWRSLSENPWIETPMNAVIPYLPPRQKGVPNAPGMFAFADPRWITDVLTASGWAPPRVEKFDIDLDIAAGYGLDRPWFSRRRSAQSTAGCVVSRPRWLRSPPTRSGWRWRRMRRAQPCACRPECGSSAASWPECRHSRR